MFSILLVLSTAANFCYRQGENFPACPDGAINVTSIEEIIAKKPEFEEITLFVSNDDNSPFNIPNKANISVPFSVIGIAPKSEVSLTLESNETTRLLMPSFTNITISVEEDGEYEDFQSISFKSVVIKNDFNVFAKNFESDIEAFQSLESVSSVNVVLSFDKIPEPKNIPITLKECLISSIHLNGLVLAVDLKVKGNQVTLAYKGKQTLVFTATLSDKASNLIVYADVNNEFNLNAEEASDKITFEPKITSNESVLTLGKDTGKLTTGRTLYVNAGKVVFPGGPFNFKVILGSGKESTFEILDGTSVDTITSVNHKLNILGKEGATLFANNFYIVGESKFVSDNKKVLGGFNINFDFNSKITTTNLDAKEFNNIEANGESVIPSLGEFGNDINVRIPFVLAGTGNLTVGDEIKRKTHINIYHSYVPNENIGLYESLINKEIPLLCSANIKCDNIDVNIESSGDVWSFTSHFTKEKIIYEKTCSDKCVGFKILENPINVYEQFAYGENWSAPVQTIRKLDTESFNWESYVTDNTKGILIMAHDNIPEAKVFDLSKANLKNKIELRIIKSPFSGAIEENPKVSINADALTGKVGSFLMDNTNVKFISSSETPKVSVDELKILHNSSFQNKFTIDSQKVSISSDVIGNVDVPTTAELTVHPTTPCDIKFTNDGWYVNDHFVSKEYSLKVHANNSKDYRISMILAEGTTAPLPMKLVHSGSSPTIFIDKAFENFKDMKPFSIESLNWDMMISVNGSYVPMSLVTPYKLRIGVGNNETMRFAEQKLTNGNEANLFFVDEESVKQIVIPKFTLNDPEDGSKKGILNSHKKILIEKIDVQTSSFAQISNAVSNLVAIATTPKTQFYSSKLNKIEVHGSMSSNEAMPTLGLKDTKVDEIVVNISTTLSGEVTQLQKELIVSETTEIASLKDKIKLSTNQVKAGNDAYNVSVELVDAKIVLNMTKVTPPPQSPTPSEQKKSNTGVIVSVSIISVIIVIVIVVGIVYFNRRKESNYETLSNEPIFKVEA